MTRPEPLAAIAALLINVAVVLLIIDGDMTTTARVACLCLWFGGQAALALYTRELLRS